ncbi:MAG: hypothetical protein IJM80_03720 [Firmicutes bacterium]|nr:hypothetical protein [Bacillota bacterium]
MSMTHKVGRIIMSLLLISAMFICDAFANEKKDNVDEISADNALSIAMLFVAGNTGELSWDRSVQIKDVRPLYGATDNVDYYYIGFESADKSMGYIVVSAKTDSPLIIEYSDDSELVVFKERSVDSVFSPISTISKRTKLYYGFFMCSEEPVGQVDFTEQVEKTNTLEEYHNNAVSIIKAINNKGLSLMRSGNYITDPVAYIQDNYPNMVFSYSTGNTVSGSVYGYVINDYNGCVVYGTAAILKYHLGSAYTYNDILYICKNTARTGYWATGFGPNGELNYYIPLGYTAPYINACISGFSGLNKTASSSLLLSSARTEISNNRPCLLNIATCDQYSDHAVTAFGWSCYYTPYEIDNPLLLYFYKVRDGYNSGARYVCDDSINGVFVTRIN